MATVELVPYSALSPDELIGRHALILPGADVPIGFDSGQVVLIEEAQYTGFKNVPWTEKAICIGSDQLVDGTKPDAGVWLYPNEWQLVATAQDLQPAEPLPAWLQ